MDRTQQHTDRTKLSVTGWHRTYNALVSILLSQCVSPLCQPVAGNEVMTILLVIKSGRLLQSDFDAWGN